MNLLTILVLINIILFVKLESPQSKCGNFICAPGIDYIGEFIDLVTGEGLSRQAIQFTTSNANNRIFVDHLRNKTWGLYDQINARHNSYAREHIYIFNRTTSFNNFLSDRTDPANKFLTGWYIKNKMVTHVDNIITNLKQYYTHTEAKIIVYEYGINNVNNIKLVQDFVDAINKLPEKYDQDTYYNKIIKIYGTHIVSSAKMGGEGIVQTGLASLFFDRYGANIVRNEAIKDLKWLQHNDPKFRNRLNSVWVKNTGITNFIIGGDITTFSMKDWDDWYKTIPDLPVRIDYNVIPLWTIVKNLLNKEKKANNIKRVIEEYLDENKIPEPKYIHNCNHIKLQLTRPAGALKRIGEYNYNSKMTSVWLVRGPHKGLFGKEYCLTSLILQRNTTVLVRIENELYGYKSKNSNILTTYRSSLSCNSSNRKVFTIPYINKIPAYQYCPQGSCWSLGALRRPGILNVELRNETCNIDCNGYCNWLFTINQPREVDWKRK